jgi:hypothetical protein
LEKTKPDVGSTELDRCVGKAWQKQELSVKKIELACQSHQRPKH